MFQILLIKVIAVLLVQANLCRCMEQCCPESAVWINGMNCSDGTRITITCPHGMYQLDPVQYPESDNFTLVEKKLSLADTSILIARHRFCVGSKSDDTPMALVCFDEPAPVTSEWHLVIFGVLCMVSALFLLATLIVYAILPELRDLQGKILTCAMTSLFGAYTLLGFIQLNPDSVLHEYDDLCKSIAFLMYYCLMSAFFWMNMVAFNVWRTAWFRKPLIPEDAWFWIYSFISWGVPSVLLMIALVGHHTKGIVIDPGFGKTNCWFVSTWESWVYLYIPVGCLMTLNVVYFALTCYELWHKYKNFSGSKLKVLRFRCILYLKLLFVMGITWVFEVISFAAGKPWKNFWLLTDILNSLQGVIIFILLVATRKRVRKLLARKKPFGINFPKQWAVGEDEECEEDLPDEEVELSQSS